MCEEPSLIVDKALFEGAIERLVAMAQAPEFSKASTILQEICFALSNVAAGTEQQLQKFL